MLHALDACGVTGEVREYLDPRLRDVAMHLRNAD
jgi:hypothetical protein